MQIVTALTLLKPLLSQECAWQLQKRLFKDGYSKLIVCFKVQGLNSTHSRMRSLSVGLRTETSRVASDKNLQSSIEALSILPSA